MIKIKENEKDGTTTQPSMIEKIHVTLENNEEKTFESYPIVIRSKEVKHLIYEIQKSTKTKDNNSHAGGFIDIVKEKAKDVKDKVVDTTKGVAGKTKDTVTPSSPSQPPELPNSSTT